MAKTKIQEEENKEPRVILGLDVSTSTIGMSVVVVGDDGKIKPVEVTHLRLNTPAKIKGAKALFMKNDMFVEKLKEFSAKYPVDTIVIEEPLLSSNNSVTVSTLLKFNGMVSLSAYHVFNVVPEYISSYDARKFGMSELMAVRKYDKKGNEYSEKKIRSAIKNNELVLFGDYAFDVAKKFVIWNYVSELFPGIEWVEDKNGELKKENFDASDSLICIMGYLSKLKYENEEPQIILWNEKETTNGSDKFLCFNYTVDFCGEKHDKKIQVKRS